MKPLVQLHNVERAKILFALFPEEIPAFLEFMKAVTDNLVRDPDQLKENWSNPFFDHRYWVELAIEAQRILDQYGHRLARRGRLFADQLFDGYRALYTAHCLQQYCIHAQPQDARFMQAVLVFFK